MITAKWGKGPSVAYANNDSLLRLKPRKLPGARLAAASPPAAL
ncbi:hypothetical protein [Synechococcus sp. L2F]|nr:hypothetical protein [Synechococcus sp. L2F]